MFYINYISIFKKSLEFPNSQRKLQRESDPWQRLQGEIVHKTDNGGKEIFISLLCQDED